MFVFVYHVVINNYSTSACGYEMLDSQRGGRRPVRSDHLVFNTRVWINCFIENAPSRKLKKNKSKKTKNKAKLRARLPYV